MTRPAFSSQPPDGPRPPRDGATLVEAEALVEMLTSRKLPPRLQKSTQGAVAQMFMALAVILEDTHATPAEADAKAEHANRILRESLEAVRLQRRTLGEADIAAGRAALREGRFSRRGRRPDA